MFNKIRKKNKDSNKLKLFSLVVINIEQIIYKYQTHKQK